MGDGSSDSGSNIIDVAMGTTAAFFGTTCGTIGMLFMIGTVMLFSIPVLCCFSVFVVMAGLN